MRVKGHSHKLVILKHEVPDSQVFPTSRPRGVAAELGSGSDVGAVHGADGRWLLQPICFTLHHTASLGSEL